MGSGLDTRAVRSLGPRRLANVPQDLGGCQRATLEEKHLWDGQRHKALGCELWGHRWTMEEWLPATGRLRREGQLRWAVAHSGTSWRWRVGELEQGLQVPWEHRWDSPGADQEGRRVEAAAALGALGGAQVYGRSSKQPRVWLCWAEGG